MEKKFVTSLFFYIIFIEQLTFQFTRLPQFLLPPFLLPPLPSSNPLSIPQVEQFVWFNSFKEDSGMLTS